MILIRNKGRIHYENFHRGNEFVLYVSQRKTKISKLFVFGDWLKVAYMENEKFDEIKFGGNL